MGKAAKLRVAKAEKPKPRAASPLHLACGAASSKALADVQKLVAQGRNVNALDEEGRTPLHLAARSDKLDVVQFLLKKGAQVNARMPRGFTALHFAVRHARMELIECLVDHGADVNATMEDGVSVAHVAIEKGRVDVVSYLMAKGADPASLTWRGVSVLQPAAREGKLEVVKFFIENGSDVNTVAPDGVSLLHDAAGREQLAVVEYLLENGANVHLTDKERRTPLHHALWGSNKTCGRVHPIVYQLASSGATWDASCEKELSELLRRHALALENAEGEGDTLELKTIRWQAGFRACFRHWDVERTDGAAFLMNIPVEVIERGEESVTTYLAGITKSGADQLIFRRKICVVGPSQWGKTSLVKSMTSLKPTLVDVDDRTIGIDLFAHTFTQEDAAAGNKQHEVTFWDFAGQDEYQVAHAMFFSKRTLYLLCIDLERYQNALHEADKHISPREAEHYMARFLRANVFRWVRAIISRQADAEFVVVGTKMDKMKSERQADLLWRDLNARLQEWVRMYAEEIDHEYAAVGGSEVSDENSHYNTLKKTLSHLFTNGWLKVSSTDAASIQRARDALEVRIAASNRSFLMPRNYTRVLDAVRSRRDKAVRMGSAGRIANTIVPVRALSNSLMREIDDLTAEECRTIMQTLHDVGDLLWYQHEASGVMKDTIIIDPTLVLDFVREVITHEHSKRIAHLPASYVEEGRLTHAFMEKLPLWQKLDEELTFAFKQLLQYFQLAYPADNADMDWDSDLIIPTYWKVNKKSQAPQRRLTKQATMMQRHGVSDASHFCWEYEVSAEVAETIFEQFAVQSYSSLLKRSVSPKCIEAYVHGDCAVLITLTSRESVRDVIRIEVAVSDVTVGWQYLRYYVMAIETVLDNFPGLIISRYIVDTANIKARRHKLSAALKVLQDANWMGKDEASVRANMPWLPADMEWFIEKAWLNPGALQQLRTQELVREAVNKVDVLKKLVVADEARRRYPALWTLEYDAKHMRLKLRMLSDLSGECFHEPIEISVPSAFFAKHGSVLQHGMSILSNVVPEIVSLGVMQKVIDAVAPEIDNQVELATTLYNMIDNLDLSDTKVVEAASSGKLSPRGAVALLRDLLKLHDNSFDELTISDFAQLQCAATADGHYVWANRREIMELGDKLTPCDLEDVKQMKRTLSSASTSSSSSSLNSSSPRKTRDGFLRLRLSIAGLDGLTAWDWRKVYCKWQLVHPDAASPLGAGSTPVHSDYSTPPSWESLEFAVSKVASLEMLRQSKLHVRVKRPSRCLGIVKCIAEGTTAIADFVPRTTEELVDAVTIHVPLDSSEVATRSVIVHLLSY